MKYFAFCIVLVLTSFKQPLNQGMGSNRATFAYELPVVVEIVANNNQQIDLQQLKKILVANKVPDNSVYQWQNHFVVFSRLHDRIGLKRAIEKSFSNLQVKIYDELLYNFDAKQRCDKPVIAKEWDHVILTASLVKDTTLQQEYVNLHRTQFEKWPEVARGFCHAGFQQLLVYRNSRQLMLIISIPKGESLDKLNPKTTENNPRVDQWNNLMKKYQEGLPGTTAGEVWVFLRKL